MNQHHSPASDRPDFSSQTARQRWMAVFAKARLPSMQGRLAQCDSLPHYHYLRPPEIGLTMVRGRAGGTGQLFNLGEMTMTRCVVQLDETVEGQVISGFGYVAGRSQQHAELAAWGDALLQHPAWQLTIYERVVTPLAVEARQRQAQSARQTEATQVNFFTLLRGEVS
ncbi:MAG: phosphonate C-P lyase system protein PhnG [Cyanobacteria bacterium P01_A01_bin.114]